MSRRATILIGDRILCDGGTTTALIRAILINPAAGVLDRVVIEPAHRVAIGQFAPADKISVENGRLTFDGYLAFFDMNTRAETPEWSNPQSRNVGTVRGSVIPVEGLITLEGTTSVLDQHGLTVGSLVGVTVRADHSLDSFVIRVPGRLRHKDVLVARDHGVIEPESTLRLSIPRDELRKRPRT